MSFTSRNHKIFTKYSTPNDFDCNQTSTYAEIQKGSITSALTSCGLNSAAYSPCDTVTTLELFQN